MWGGEGGVEGEEDGRRRRRRRRRIVDRRNMVRWSVKRVAGRGGLRRG